MAETVNNKQIILKEYISRGYPKESDMVTQVSKMSLKVPHGCQGIVVKNLYLSCDPYMRSRMTKIEGSYVDSFTPGQVIILYTHLHTHTHLAYLLHIFFFFLWWFLYLLIVAIFFILNIVSVRGKNTHGELIVLGLKLLLI